MVNKSLRIIFGVGLMLLVFIIVSVTLFNYVVIMNESIDTDMISIEIIHTDNNNIIINHESGSSINEENLKITVDDKEIDAGFEGEFNRGESIVFNKTSENKEFKGGEQINIYVNDNLINTKIISK